MKEFQLRRLVESNPEAIGVLLEAQQRARRHAEEARDRTRRLQKLTGTLSGALEKDAVMTIMVSAGREALGARAGFAWLLRDEDTLELAASACDERPAGLDSVRIIPMSARLPVCDAVRTGRPLMFESLAAMMAQYPAAVLTRDSPYMAWAVIPVVVAGQAIGGVSFSFDRERRCSDEDRELLVAMIGQASLALERCRLLEAERRARTRERQLHVLAARLSSALTPEQVAAIACDEVLSVVHAFSTAAAIRAGEEVQVIGTGGPRDDAALARVARLPLAAAVPIAEAVLRSELVWCANRAELAARYPELEDIWMKLGLRSWGAVPFAFEGHTIGSLGLSFSEERVLDDGERQFLLAAGQLAAQALERARLYEALRSSEDQLRSALAAARAGTWRVDLDTMTGHRDPSHHDLVDVNATHAAADFERLHPDDRPIARAHFERSLREGVPYEPEVRVQREDGSYFWIRAHGRVVRGADGKPSALTGVVVDIDEAKRASLRAEEERRINETLHRLGSSFASELEQDRLVQLIIDEVTRLIGADGGVFFEREQPGTAPTLWGGHAAARSRLSVPVVARSGELFGHLLFVHPEPGRFDADHERLVTSIAREAAVALENARLYKTVRDQKEQLEAAVERARLADRRKDEFLAMLGHELRNPLAPITTALSLMDLTGNGAYEKERNVIRRQVAHLTRLVDDLLDVARITRGKVQLSRQSVEIGTLLAKALETVSPLLEKRSQRVSIDAPREGLLVDADATRLVQVFQNLLMNAAKFSDVGSTVSLRARGDSGRVVVQVSDRGIGIPCELMPRLFDLFEQGERASDRSQGGLGIGLTIAKSLCELHGGTIRVESDGPGQGSTFTVLLPLGAEAGTRASEHPRPAPHGASRGERVLVVDDNVDAAQTLRDFLATLGHDVAMAHDGVDALRQARDFRPTVAVLDIGLPVMDGYELARHLRELQGSKDLRLIAVTGYGQDGDRRRSLEAGFHHHLVKPLEPQLLVALLEASPRSRQ